MTLNKIAGAGPGVNPFGPINPPAALAKYGSGVQGVPVFISILLKSLIMMAAIYAVFNFVIAGYWYISAGGEPKRIQAATEKIWQTVLGLTIAAAAFIIAAIIGQLIFSNPNALLKIEIFEPPL